MLLQLSRIVFFDPRKLYNDDGSPKGLSEIDDDTVVAIAGIEMGDLFEGSGEDRAKVGEVRKIKVADRLAAIQAAMKHLGIQGSDKTELTGKEGGPVQFDAVLDKVYGG